MEKNMKITVLGGGNSAKTMAADFALAGHEVNLCDLPQFSKNIEHIMESRQLIKVGLGRQGIAKLNMVSTDISEAIKGANIVMLAIPQVGQMPFYEAIADKLEDGQIVVTIPGNWGALVLFNLLEEKGIDTNVKIAQTNSCMQICREGESFMAPGVIRQFSKRGMVQISAMPAIDTESVLNTLKPMYPILAPATNVLEASLNSSNITGHGPIMLMNGGWIENPNEQFFLYRDGTSPSVGRCVDTITNERDSILSAFGITPQPSGSFYEGVKKGTWVHDPSQQAPTSLTHRFISEDVPHAMVPMSNLGDLLNVPTTISDAIINLASVANDIDYWTEGTTLEKLGLNGLTPDEITNFLKTGEK